MWHDHRIPNTGNNLYKLCKCTQITPLSGQRSCASPQWPFSLILASLVFLLLGMIHVSFQTSEVTSYTTTPVLSHFNAVRNHYRKKIHRLSALLQILPSSLFRVPIKLLFNRGWPYKPVESELLRMLIFVICVTVMLAWPCVTTLWRHNVRERIDSA